MTTPEKESVSMHENPQRESASVAKSAQSGHASSDLLVLVASALFWSWFDSGVFRPTFLAPFCSSAWMFFPYLVAAIASGGAVLLVACFMHRRLSTGADAPSRLHLDSSGWIGSAALGLVGSAASLFGAALASLPLVLLGAIGVGASCGAFQLMWGAIYTRGGSKFAGRTVALSIALGVFIDVLVMGLDAWFAAAFTAILPLVSSGLALFLLYEDAFPRASPQADPSQHMHEAVFGSHRTLGGLPVSLLVAFGLFGLSFGYCQHNAVFQLADSTSYSSDALIAARGATSLAIFVLLTLFPLKSYAVFKIGTLVGIAGFVAAPLLSLFDTQGITQSIVIAIGYTTFDIATWALIAELACTAGGSPIRLIGCGRCAIHATEVLAITICSALSAFPSASEALNSTFGYGCVIAEMLLLADNSALWLLIKSDVCIGLPERPETRPQQNAGRAAGIAEIATAYDLTARESEVLALLAAGHGRARVAQALGISENTLGTHIQQLYRKLGVHSRQELLDKLNG